MRSYSICLSLSDLFHIVYIMSLRFIHVVTNSKVSLFNGWIICRARSHFLYPFIHWWTRRLPKCLHCYKKRLPWCLRGWRIRLQCQIPEFNPWVGKIPGEENGNPLQYSCLENPIDRGAWSATIHGVTESQTQLKQRSMHTCMVVVSFIFLRKLHTVFHSDCSTLHPHQQYIRFPLFPTTLPTLFVSFFFFFDKKSF